MKTGKVKEYDTVYIKHQLESGRLDPSPDYQRNAVWTRPQKQLLIDSIIRGYDLPKFYWRKEADKWQIVDGQQRTRAIVDFLSGRFGLGKDFEEVEGSGGKKYEIAKKKYSDLDPYLKDKLDSYTITVVEVEASDDEISELFQRLQNGTSLKTSEKLHANNGELATYLKNIVDSRELWKRWTNIRKVRFDDFLSAMILWRLFSEGGSADIKKEQLEKLLSDKLTDEKKKSFERLLKLIETGFSAYAPGGYKLKNHQLVSLFILLLKLDTEFVFKIDKEFIEWFIDIEKKRLEINADDERDETDSVISDFMEYNTNILGGDNRTKLNGRLDFLFRHYALENQDLEQKEKTRVFSFEQKNLLLHKQGHKCAICGTDISIENCEADHIKEYDDGGRTTIANGQALCAKCHSEKTRKFISSRRTKKE